MIGDFHGRANALWSLYGKRVKRHDKTRIQPLNEEMDGVLIFVRPYFLRGYNRLTAVVLIHTFTGWFIFRCPH